MIPNYPNRRRINCETGVFDNMLAYYGYDISEELLFGIGSGLYFMYSPFLSISGTVYPLMRLQPVEIVKRAAERLCINVHVRSFGDNRGKATEVLDKLLERSIPIGVDLNVKGLPYFNALGFVSDFNGHIVSVIGKDGRDYVIADTDSRLPTDDYVRVDKGLIQELRFSPGIATPHGKIFWVDPATELISSPELLRKAIADGLKETCNKFLRVPLPYYGVRGLHYFANDIRKWWKEKKQRQISFIIMWYYRLIERTGTGGSGYRYIYRDFLKEAALLFESVELEKSAEMMGKAAESWRQFSVEGRRFIRDPQESILQTIADVVDQIGDYECNAFRKIQNGFIVNQK